ncbi:MAG: hypothetical protein KIT73_17185 [Burkholderiales bacterium]|nr:hypothetical protein [Burkholderiales bacterium]
MSTPHRILRRVVNLLLAALVILPTTGHAHDPSAWGGVFRSRDSGQTWLPVDAGLFIGGAMAVAVHPTDPNHLLYATDTRLLRSRNGGRDWIHEAPDRFVGPTLAVAFDADGHGAVAASSAGVFRFRDDVASWSPVDAPENASPARLIVADSSRPGHFVLGAPGGLFTSVDGGRRWYAVGGAAPRSQPTALHVAGDSALAVIGGNVWIRDGDNPWHRVDQGLPLDRIETVTSDAAAGIHRWWAFGGNRLYRSDDRGTSWRTVGTALDTADTSVREIAPLDGGRVIVLTTHRGLWRSNDGGEHWNQVEGALPVHLEASPLLRDPHDAQTLYAGFALTPYPEIWRRAEQGNNLMSQIDPVSLAGAGAMFGLLLMAGVWTARRLARAAGASSPSSPSRQIPR